MAGKAKATTTKKKAVVEEGAATVENTMVVEAVATEEAAKTVEEALEAVDTTIKEVADAEEPTFEAVEEAIKDHPLLDSVMTDMDEGQKAVDAALEVGDAEVAAEVIKKEIAKATDNKEKVKKVIAQKGPQMTTAWWNGMGYDM